MLYCGIFLLLSLAITAVSAQDRPQTLLEKYFGNNTEKFQKAIDSIFEKLDINENDFITKEELQASWSALKNDTSDKIVELMQSIDVDRTQFESAQQRLQDLIMSFDQNQDGQVGLDKEFRPGMWNAMNLPVPNNEDICDKTKFIVESCRIEPNVVKVNSFTRVFFSGLCNSGIAIIRGYRLESCVLGNAGNCTNVAQCYQKDVRDAYYAQNHPDQQQQQLSQNALVVRKRNFDVNERDMTFAVFFLVGIALIPAFVLTGPIGAVAGFIYFAVLALAFFIDVTVRISIS